MWPKDRTWDADCSARAFDGTWKLSTLSLRCPSITITLERSAMKLPTNASTPTIEKMAKMLLSVTVMDWVETKCLPTRSGNRSCRTTTAWTPHRPEVPSSWSAVTAWAEISSGSTTQMIRRFATWTQASAWTSQRIRIQPCRSWRIVTVELRKHGLWKGNSNGKFPSKPQKRWNCSKIIIEEQKHSAAENLKDSKIIYNTVMCLAWKVEVPGVKKNTFAFLWNKASDIPRKMKFSSEKSSDFFYNLFYSSLRMEKSTQHS